MGEKLTTARTVGVELAPEMPVDTVASLAARAEAAGFDVAFVSHHYNNRDEFQALTHAAIETEQIKLGPGVTNPYETHPVTLASRMATLDELADCRGIFGVGPGDRSTLENLGIDRDRALSRVLETMQVARKLFDGARVDHDGTFVADDAGLNYAVEEIPIYVGGQGPHMTRMAAKHADGLLFNGSHPRDIQWAREHVNVGREARPDTRGAFDFTVYTCTSVSDSKAQAREAAKPPVAFIAAGAPEPVLNRHDIDRDRAHEIGTKIAEGAFSEAFGLVSESMIDAFALAGTPERVATHAEELLGTADGIVFGSPLGPDIETAIDLLGEKIG